MWYKCPTFTRTLFNKCAVLTKVASACCTNALFSASLFLFPQNMLSHVQQNWLIVVKEVTQIKRKTSINEALLPHLRQSIAKSWSETSKYIYWLKFKILICALRSICRTYLCTLFLCVWKLKKNYVSEVLEPLKNVLFGFECWPKYLLHHYLFQNIVIKIWLVQQMEWLVL